VHGKELKNLVHGVLKRFVLLQVDKLRDDYCAKLRKAYADLGWKLLRSFPVDQLQSSMQERFLDTFRSYIPLYVREVLLPYNTLSSRERHGFI